MDVSGDCVPQGSPEAWPHPPRAASGVGLSEFCLVEAYEAQPA